MSLLALCEALRQRVAEAPAGDARGAREGVDALPALSAAFEAALREHKAQQEGVLFPALLESMAGSDAVCLHEIASDLSAEHRALESLWHRAAVGGTTAGVDAEALVALCERHLAFEHTELWPMAERLLSDAIFARLGPPAPPRAR